MILSIDCEETLPASFYFFVLELWSSVPGRCCAPSFAFSTLISYSILYTSFLCLIFFAGPFTMFKLLPCAFQLAHKNRKSAYLARRLYLAQLPSLAKIMVRILRKSTNKDDFTLSAVFNQSYGLHRVARDSGLDGDIVSASDGKFILPCLYFLLTS